ncbi:UNVERIFIED_CONTAM: hypothetical protein PYX00_009584 [Menopon gallinae]|uniref:Odorant receptor n=1 Tax=Menopon gallinae TaxID=328185 RepID=A0AAW2HBM1_9NEOP
MDSMDDVRGPDIDIEKLIKDDTSSLDFIFTILRFVGIRRGGQGPNFFSYAILGYCSVFVGLQMVDLMANSNLQNRADRGKFFAACLSALTQYIVFHAKSGEMQQFQEQAIFTNKFMLSKYKWFYDLDDPTKPFERTQRSIWSSYGKSGISDNDAVSCYGRQASSIWKFFDCQNPVNFFLIFIFQDLFCGIIFLHVLWGFAAFRINVTLNMLTQIRFLHNFIEKIGVRKKPLPASPGTPITELENPPSENFIPNGKLQPLTNEAIARQLDICIKFHNFIQKEQDILNDIFSQEVLMEFGCFTFLNCLTIFQAFSERKILRLMTLFIFLCFGIGYLYSICEMGSALRFQCAHLTKAAYQCKWCTFRPPERRTVIMIIHKAQRTKYLRGGKIFDISVQTFVQLVRMSYSLLLFLFNMQTSNRISELKPSSNS